MWKALVAKWFCLHEWSPHAKVNPAVAVFAITKELKIETIQSTSKTIEHVKCIKCGKFHKLEY